MVADLWDVSCKTYLISAAVGKINQMKQNTLIQLVTTPNKKISEIVVL